MKTYVGLALTAIAAAFLPRMPFVSGFLFCLALAIAMSDDDDEPPRGPNEPQPT